MGIITRRNRVDDIKTDETGRVVDDDLLQFIDLVTKCLDLDPDTRLTPAEALCHPFSQKILKKAAAASAPKSSAAAAAGERGDIANNDAKLDKKVAPAEAGE